MILPHFAEIQSGSGCLLHLPSGIGQIDGRPNAIRRKAVPPSVGTRPLAFSLGGCSGLTADLRSSFQTDFLMRVVQ